MSRGDPRGIVGAVVILLTSCAVGFANSPQGESAPDPADALQAFVESHRKSDGLFGPPQSPSSEPRWTYRALRSLRLVSRFSERPDELAKALGGQFLGRRVRAARAAAVSSSLQEIGKPLPAHLAPPSWPPLLPHDVGWHGSVDLRALRDELIVGLKSGRELTPKQRAEIRAAVMRWRAKDGGFGFPAAMDAVREALAAKRYEGILAVDDDRSSSIATTLRALQILDELGAANRDILEQALIFLASCRRDDGFVPRPGVDEVSLVATHQALSLLDAAGRPLTNRRGILKRLRGLRHIDGGFAFLREEPPSLEATWRALECFRILSADPFDGAVPPCRGALPPPRNEEGLLLFQAAIEFGPEPMLSVALARHCGIDLVFIKEVGLRLSSIAADRIASGRGGEVVVGTGTEEYFRGFGVPGVGWASHCSDLLHSPTARVGTRTFHVGIDAMNEAWASARKGGALVAGCGVQQRDLLEEAYHLSVSSGRRFGYDLIAATYAFADEGDLILEHPWLHRFVGRLPVFGNFDAHHDPAHFIEKGLSCRTLFFSRKGDLEGFRDAVQANRLVAVAHGRGGTALYGHPHWVARARAETAKWDRGRKGVGPLAMAVDAVSAPWVPWVREGRAVLVRALHGSGDDAFPHEVECRIGGKRVPLRMAPVPDVGHQAAALWAPVDLPAGEHVVELRAFGKTSRRRLRFGAAVEDSTAAPLPKNRKPAPDHLAFRSLAESAYIQSYPSPSAELGRQSTLKY